MSRVFPYFIFVLTILLLPALAVAANPTWSTFQQTQPVYSIDDISYQLNLSETGASGQITLHGQVLQGRPQPVLLFGRDLMITGIGDIQGGRLLSDAEGYKFFIQETAAPFQLSLDIALPVQEDQRSLFVAFQIPAAVRNALRLSLSDQLRLIEAPGLQQQDGAYYFSPNGRLQLRFEDAALGHGDAAPAVDIFNRIRLAGNKFRVSTYFVPVRKITAALTIQLPANSYLDSTLKPSWLKPAGGQLLVTLPRDWQQPFSIDYEVPVESETLTLATLDNNQGREGEFQIEEPLEARLTAVAEHLQSDIPAPRLPATLRDFAAVSGSYLRLPADSALRIDVQRFETVTAPEIVLEAIHLYTSFSENGTALSVLRLELPAAGERKLQLNPIPGAEIWSLTVNAQPRSLFSHQSGSWVIPLDEGASVIELAYLQKGEKLGLEGRLNVMVPATGLAARKLNVAIALAERVELIAMEGGLEPTQGSGWPTVQGFAGKPYFFTRPFYRGDQLDAAIYYQEPLDTSEQ